MIIHAGPEGLALSALNLAKTAYCSFTYRKSFFQKYVPSRSVRAGARSNSSANGHASADDGGTSSKWMLHTKVRGVLFQ